MSDTIIYYIRLIFTNYLIGIIFVSGLILSFFITSSIPASKYPIENKIAKYGGIIYIFIGVAMFFIRIIIM